MFIITHGFFAILTAMISSRRKSYHQQYLRQRLIIYSLVFVAIFIVVGFILSFAVFAWYAKDLPSPGKLSQGTEYSTVFYDRDGKILYEMFKDKNRLPVVLSDISDYVKKGTIAIEDKNFYKHQGISQTGILRAFFNILFRNNVQGGSTITQQLIKNSLLTSERSMSRKIKEMILALEVERRYTKDQILEMYLNDAPYGGPYWGVASASKAYFNKESKDLNLVEAAILVGLPQSPSYYSPFIGKEAAWKNRARNVLRRMREDGYITKTEERLSSQRLDTVKFNSPKLPIKAPHFVFYVKDLIEKKFGSKLIDQGIKVKTTLSLETQEASEEIVEEEIKGLTNYKVTNGSVVVLDSQTNDILAMVGSYDFNDNDFGKFNATLGLRQPGSAVKPITYALALENGYTASYALMDVKTVFPNQGDEDYIPEDYDEKYRGVMQLRFALGNSINVPAVKLLAMIGVRSFLQKAYDLGFDTLSPSDENLKKYGLAITLGGGEVRLLDLTSAFSVFARAGIRKKPKAIIEISDYKGKSIFIENEDSGKRVFSEGVSFIISHILSDNNARMEIFGPNSYLNIPGKTVAVKTGTTNDKRDNWAIGYTKGVTVGVWVGNNDNTPMNEKIASGATGASPIFYKLMRTLLKNYPDGIMDKPDNVEAMNIDAYLGGLPKEGYPTRTEYFIKGTEPKNVSPFYKKLKISKANGKLANEIEVKSGNYEEKDFVIINESDPISLDGKNRWQEAIDEWMKGQADQKYHPPLDTSDASFDDLLVSIKTPDDKSTLSSNKTEIKAKFISLTPLKKVEIYLSGILLKSFDGDKKEIDETFDIADGAYELKVVATNEKDKKGESTIKFGVNKPWDTITPTITPTP